MMTNADTRLSVIYGYFGKAPANDYRPKAGTLTTFREEWKALSESDKEQLQEGIRNETLTY